MENKEFLRQFLEQAKKPIPCTWRVQSFSKNKPVATVMAYIDARDAMDVLDAYAAYGWHREHYMVESKVYCKVGIVFPDGSIQWRSDCGTESNQDAEKGQASDSFKRACVNWGIGRFLYDLPIQYVTTNAKKEASNYPYCIDEQGKQIWDLTKHINSKIPNAPKAPNATHETAQPTPQTAGRSNVEIPAHIVKQLESVSSRAELEKAWADNPGWHKEDKFLKAFQAIAKNYPKPQTA